ncbi:peptidase A24 [Halobacteriales archaeon QS_8_69_26]|nr:MAG: peptidase A24 [Halobacteriales archaeon QS_8_69_26]
MIDLELVLASPGDLLRLVAVPVLGWAAYRDVRTRRVPNRTWLPLGALGLALLAWDAWGALAGGGVAFQVFALRAGIALGFLVPFAYLFWAFGGFGGADAKAIMVLAVLFPTYPEYLLGAPIPDMTGVGTLPVVGTTVGVFAFTVLTNAVLVGAAYPVAVTLRNAVRGRFTPVMFVGRPIPVERLADTHGRLLETPDGFTRRGLDLDALRMYLRWRRADLGDLRADPETFRDPDSLPETPGQVGDGAVRTDGGSPSGDEDGSTVEEESGGAAAEAEPEGATAEEEWEEATAVGGPDGATGEDPDHPSPGDTDAALGAPDDDPWGAAAFVEEFGEVYGTGADDLRAGLEVVAGADRVWVSPGLPFMVPLFAGLVVGLLYGDLLFAGLRALGLV